MLMCEKMILTVLVVAVALGAESELKVGICLFASAADSTFMPCYSLWRHLNTSFVGFSSLYLFWTQMIDPSGLKIEKSEVNKLEKNTEENTVVLSDKSVKDCLKSKKGRIEYTQIFHFDRYYKHK